jgi:hypothetical protein
LFLIGIIFTIFLDGISDKGKRSYIEEELQCINDIADRARGYKEFKGTTLNN